MISFIISTLHEILTVCSVGRTCILQGGDEKCIQNFSHKTLSEEAS
jgi:hypothetical protein